jgi:hAT family C-terminal dimerisation region
LEFYPLYTLLITYFACMQKHSHLYPTLARIACDVCPIPASSVPCERLFSGGAETATDRCSRLGTDRFEQLQMLKHEWRGNIVDFATYNSITAEEVWMDDFHEIYQIDKEMAESDTPQDDV